MQYQRTNVQSKNGRSNRTYGCVRPKDFPRWGKNPALRKINFINSRWGSESVTTHSNSSRSITSGSYCSWSRCSSALIIRLQDASDSGWFLFFKTRCNMLRVESPACDADLACRSNTVVHSNARVLRSFPADPGTNRRWPLFPLRKCFPGGIAIRLQTRNLVSQVMV